VPAWEEAAVHAMTYVRKGKKGGPKGQEGQNAVAKGGTENSGKDPGVGKEDVLLEDEFFPPRDLLEGT